MVVILLLNVMELFSVVRGVLLERSCMYGLPKSVCVVPVILKNFHCMNNAYIDNKTHSSPNIHIIFDAVHRDRKMKENRKRWEEVSISTDLTHNNRKEWKTIIQEPLQ